VLRLVKRIGPKGAESLVADMLLDPTPCQNTEPHQWLRQLDSSIPKPVQGDRAVLAVAEVFGKKPASFALCSLRELLGDRIANQIWPNETKAAWRKQVKNWPGSDWVFATRTDRERGIRAARDVVKNYRPIADQSSIR
jgi:hypothetical protein